MNKQIEALKKALGRIKSARDCPRNAVGTLLFEAEEILESALVEQPSQQEPVAMRDAIVVNLVREGINKHRARELADHFIGLATPQPPAQRAWVGLTDKERESIANATIRIHGQDWAYATAIEAKLRSKNEV